MINSNFQLKHEIDLNINIFLHRFDSKLIQTKKKKMKKLSLSQIIDNVGFKTGGFSGLVLINDPLTFIEETDTGETEVTYSQWVGTLNSISDGKVRGNENRPGNQESNGFIVCSLSCDSGANGPKSRMVPIELIEKGLTDFEAWKLGNDPSSGVFLNSGIVPEDMTKEILSRIMENNPDIVKDL